MPRGLRERHFPQSIHGPTAARTRRGDARGTSLTELVVVIAVLGIGLGMMALHLRPLETPLRTAGELIDATIKQTRARSMAVTTAHRLRPASPERVVVESAPSCTALAWSLDPRMGARLPLGVRLADSDWEICFDTRGFASTNVVLEIEHPGHGMRRLEVLRGGAVRWLP